jgi:hypothetical protein
MTCVNCEIHWLSYHAPQRGSSRPSADSVSTVFVSRAGVDMELDNINGPRVLLG